MRRSLPALKGKSTSRYITLVIDGKAPITYSRGDILKVGNYPNQITIEVTEIRHAQRQVVGKQY